MIIISTKFTVNCMPSGMLEFIHGLSVMEKKYIKCIRLWSKFMGKRNSFINNWTNLMHYDD